MSDAENTKRVVRDALREVLGDAHFGGAHVGNATGPVGGNAPACADDLCEPRYAPPPRVRDRA
ncbi:MAG: hypothetical protein KC417_09000, partial [Myxococcales bacterium]|nr:hypothetical protein [Myxococcales bacterium]